jgi:S-adenosyl-L-methionine hydrolase (adenosine-forming)
MATPVITLTTDFGTRDGFAAQMKGVILSIAPTARIVDVTNDIAAFCVLEGALVLKGMVRYFPEGTIHVAVVDPGVGTARRGIALRAGNQIYVGPDNGIFSLILADEPSREIREIQNPEFVHPLPHPTFHGRDVFAPAAAHLAAGKAFESVGDEVHDPAILTVPAPEITSEGIKGEIIYVDRFGNLTSNVEARMLTREVGTVSVAHKTLSGLSRSFGEVPEGKTLALINSFGYLEIAINRRDAAGRLQIGKGAPIGLKWK